MSLNVQNCKTLTELWKWSPLFRSPAQLTALQQFFIADPIKNHVLEEFATGFVSHFEYPVPEPWGSVSNYPPLKTPQGATRFRQAMEEQVRAGKMIGGKGWSARHVREFFGGANFYGIPCSATAKGGDPLGRIVHDYG